eukprot:GHRQ01019995.1.p1 GENE.GHRQ01019995.1~~GHRQ01019995.1.p1  ORF type:complete len:190 (+),score=37.64 GHRQ01019995.1:981-1550(+)
MAARVHPSLTVLLPLQGVWGGIVRQWLHELLPADAAQRCSKGRVRIVLTTLPFLQRQVVTDFKVCAPLHDAGRVLVQEASARARGSACRMPCQSLACFHCLVAGPPRVLDTLASLAYSLRPALAAKAQLHVCNTDCTHMLRHQDRDDLVATALASAHLPIILDWRLTASWRGRACVDGSLLYILTRWDM